MAHIIDTLIISGLLKVVEWVLTNDLTIDTFYVRSCGRKGVGGRLFATC